MEKLFVSYEIAKLLKEKGFNENCFLIQLSDSSEPEYIAQASISHEIMMDTNNSWLEDNVSRDELDIIGPLVIPLYQQVIDWFREKHALIITILPKYMSRNFRGYEIESVMIGKIKVLNQDEDIPYYEALDKAIEEALKLI